jgi:hypothetical protein
MLGGMTNSDKLVMDVWRFDFENVSPKSHDLHGVVAERLSDLPFLSQPIALTSTNQGLICVTKTSEFWLFS